MKINVDDLFQTPSPLEPLDLEPFGIFGHEVYVKRDDLIHQIVSGNKWRKLKHNIICYTESEKKGIATFGGAHSNHIIALAFVANHLNIPSIAFIRGEKPVELSPTLKKVIELGMHIHYVQRNVYKNRNKMISWVKINYPSFYIVPEGGANILGVKGCKEIIKEIDLDFDEIYCDVGAGATLAGLVAGIKPSQFAKGIVVLKGAQYLEEEVQIMIKEFDNKPRKNFTLIHDYHFGGFAKKNRELEVFMKLFYDTTGIKTDPIYSGKMFYGLIKELERSTGNKKRIIALHTGGLQGVYGYEKRYDVKIYA